MTDAIRSALAGPLASQSSADRNAFAGNDDQGDFDRALAAPQKGDQKAEDTRHAAGAPHEQRWHKLAERLAARDPRVAEPGDDATDARPTMHGEQAEAPEPPLAEASPKEPASSDKPAETALPLVLALSELRKAGSQAASAGPADAPATEAGTGLEQPSLAADAPDSEPRLVGNAPSRAAASGIALPPGMSAAAETPALADASSAPAGSATGDAEADTPARPVASRQPDQAAATNRVSVISEQAIPAPATSVANGTAGALAMDIASSAPRHTAAAATVQQLQASAANAPAAQVLKIQLRPVELGMVTASLHLAGEQLSVEIEVENAEAYHRLSADREAIGNALRGLGFDVDRVTILQPQSPAQAQARSDGSGLSSGSGGREQPAFQSDGMGGEGGNSGNGRPGGRAANEEANARNISSPRTDRPGSSRYI
ncbi:flagellar hook-length control protein FliK [Aminobacter aganoensis]|uniref:Chemotaxis protein MotD n=1 Tax=Aminobacter aganoensis TaxID=83264 RepID=A0A7X0KLJ8_9HYPH|nr:flagellar hook-length control protein FliK [Aminobacter aganoensis]MBB6355155.1 chemotaxis protein MotD [Aminobacter aganoensis]